ncbi:MAG: DPP IV N-terminal domain-containing protein [Saprospiraceae bacterium]
MNKFIALFAVLLCTNSYVHSQTSFGNWIDNEHITLRKDGKWVQYNIETGQELAYQASASEASARDLTPQPDQDKNATFSPDQSQIAYTRGGNLFVMEVATKKETQLTFDGNDLILNGYASWVYYEEILGRSSRYKAFYWSPDNQHIAFLRFDDHQVPEFPIFHHEADDMTHGYLEKTRYPKSGDPLPGTQLKMVQVKTKQITNVPLNESLEYTAMVQWNHDGSKLVFQQLNRDQNDLTINVFNPSSQEFQMVYEEKQKTWVDWVEDLHLLQETEGAILRSNISGWFNLYRIDFKSKTTQPLTKNNWRVTGITEVNEKSGTIFFTGTGENPSESHFYRVNFKSGEQTKLTDGSGSHRISLSPDGQHFISTFSNVITPNTIQLYKANGTLNKTIDKGEEDANQSEGIKVEMTSFTTSDGLTLPIHWVLPPNFDPTKKYPVIFTIYGGPNAGTVYNRYRDYSKNDLVNAGIILFTVDHRASGKLGKKGMDYMHRSLGRWEMHDYFEAVEWLRAKDFIDPSRMGIMGSSYGGYMTAMALTYGADYFTHGVSSAPVTDWHLYDNAYTERFMDTPKDNPEGYAFGSVMTHVPKFKGKLLLIHGTIDDNVHMQNSVQLVSKLQDEGKSFEFMIYPGGRHGWGGAKRVHSNQLTNDFWMRHFFNR